MKHIKTFEITVTTRFREEAAQQETTVPQKGEFVIATDYTDTANKKIIDFLHNNVGQIGIILHKLGNNVDNHNDRLHRLAKLKSIVVNNIVTFKGKHEDNNYYENVKGLITNIFLGEGFSSFEFVISDYSISMNMNILNYYKVDNTIPIKIHITESIANKFNL